MTEPPTTRLRLDLAYEGTDFAGWARQPGLRTVQGELEAALSTVLREPSPRLVVAGRTDAGVHASGQVAHVDLTESQLQRIVGRRPGDTGSALASRLNGIAGLRSDVVVRSAVTAPRGFDARFSPVWRRYAYRIADAHAQRDPMTRRFTLWHPAALDLDAMNAATAQLTGLHDWAAYCRPREGATSIRELQRFDWRRDPDGVLVARLQADAFCHSMVRALVGAAVAVGAGRMPGERMASLRDERARVNEFVVMPASGLTLTEVGYPPDDRLGERAERTRAIRESPLQ